MHWDRLWSIEDLASYLNCNKRTIYHLTSNNRIPFSKVGRHLRFDPQAIKAHFYNQNEVIIQRNIAEGGFEARLKEAVYG